MPSPALISFVHIPKTAGSTVRTAPADAFPKSSSGRPATRSGTPSGAGRTSSGLLGGKRASWYDELPADAAESATRNLRPTLRGFRAEGRLDESLVMFGRMLDLGRLR
jgi:hypothetical protein